MRIKKIYLAAIAALLISPVFTTIWLVMLLMSTFDSVRLLPADQRPKALADGLASAVSPQHYGILLYVVGAALMSYVALSGYRKDSHLLWKVAVSTGIFTCFQDHFFIGLISLGVLIWRRAAYRPDPLNP